MFYIKMLRKIAVLLTFTTIGYCDIHVYGTENAGDKLLFEKVLFSHNLMNPKNYTLIFKYIGSESSPNITYAKFVVQNGKSQGIVEANAEKGQEKILQAQLNIINGTNINVIGQIYGPSVSLLDANQLLKTAFTNADASNSKTVTVVYGHNTTKTRNRMVNIGHRQSDDELLDFQSKNVTLMYRFAESAFEYKHNQHSITAVHFSFNSPSAIAFINSTFLDEHNVNAIIYDLNSQFFVANMSIYGYFYTKKPETYKPIVMKRIHGIF